MLRGRIQAERLPCCVFSFDHSSVDQSHPRFDGAGFRTNFTLEIVELKREGLEKVTLHSQNLPF